MHVLLEIYNINWTRHNISNFKLNSGNYYMNIVMLEDLPHHVQTFQHLLLLSDVLPALLFSHDTTEPPIHLCPPCPSDHGVHFGKNGNSNSF